MKNLHTKDLYISTADYEGYIADYDNTIVNYGADIDMISGYDDNGIYFEFADNKSTISIVDYKTDTTYSLVATRLNSKRSTVQFFTNNIESSDLVIVGTEFATRLKSDFIMHF